MENNNDKLLQQCTCPICKETVLLEYEKRVSYNLMSSYTIKIIQGCKHFCEGELINENYVRLLNSLIKDVQIDYNRLVESRTKRKLQEMGLNKEDLRGLF